MTLTLSIPKRILIVIVIQTLVLFAMIAYRQSILASETHITLETLPMDPRSLFAGDYVLFRYKITENPIPEDLQGKLRENQTVYVILTPKGSSWITQSIHREKPEFTSPDLMIKGRVEYVSGNDVFISYGIENYFIPEGQGKSIEHPEKEQPVMVEVAVDRFGNAAISSVLLGGKEIYKEKLF